MGGSSFIATAFAHDSVCQNGQEWFFHNMSYNKIDMERMYGDSDDLIGGDFESRSSNVKSSKDGKWTSILIFAALAVSIGVLVTCIFF